MQKPTILSAQQVSKLVQMLSPQQTEGISLAKRKSTAILGKDHYGFVISGKYLKNFGLPERRAKVIRRIYEFGTKVVENDFDPLAWQVLYKMPQNEIPLAILRTNLTRNDKYNLLFDNCEHFARFVTTGKKESSQVQNVIGLGLIGLFSYFLLRGDN